MKDEEAFTDIAANILARTMDSDKEVKISLEAKDSVTTTVDPQITMHKIKITINDDQKSDFGEYEKTLNWLLTETPNSVPGRAIKNILDFMGTEPFYKNYPFRSIPEEKNIKDETKEVILIKIKLPHK